MLGAELAAAAQAGGLVGVAGLQAEQGQLQQGGRRGRCLARKQDKQQQQAALAFRQAKKEGASEAEVMAVSGTWSGGWW